MNHDSNYQVYNKTKIKISVTHIAATTSILKQLTTEKTSRAAHTNEERDVHPTDYLQKFTSRWNEWSLCCI